MKMTKEQWMFITAGCKLADLLDDFTEHENPDDEKHPTIGIKYSTALDVVTSVQKALNEIHAYTRMCNLCFPPYKVDREEGSEIISAVFEQTFLALINQTNIRYVIEMLASVCETKAASAEMNPRTENLSVEAFAWDEVATMLYNLSQQGAVKEVSPELSEEE